MFTQSIPECYSCKQPITDICLTAFGLQWHPHHIGCNTCGKDFSDGSRCEEGPDGFAYCSKDLLDKFAPKCQKCKQPIIGQTTNAVGKTYHPEHFQCETCNMVLTGNFYHTDDGTPYCEKHYYEKIGFLCKHCDKPIISGKCITVGTTRFHPEHFFCQFCKSNLSGVGYKKQGEKCYCTECFLKLYG
ncbi:hypothetical protein RB653_009758 [Dictyostelium firmibasis]|uniref:LIM zinc-binding domain-containing protein n=1 Tax=Dictyostelium firmibasis TaxID=79012 RepID=A0AAN7YV07_9MYCE